MFFTVSPVQEKLAFYLSNSILVKGDHMLELAEVPKSAIDMTEG